MWYVLEKDGEYKILVCVSNDINVAYPGWRVVAGPYATHTVAAQHIFGAVYDDMHRKEEVNA